MTALKDAVFELFLREVKSSTSFRCVEYMPDTVKDYGFTGPFAGLDKFFTQAELVEELEKHWEDIE